MDLHRDNSLLAIALEDRTVLIVDVECRKPIRKFRETHSEKILAMDFSPSGHWLITAGKEGKVKVQ